MKYALKFSYDGTNYCGWQIQPNRNTVQAELQKALSIALGQPIEVVASGRTDSGVHAEGQVCHFECQTTVPAERITDAVNVRLPADIRVLKSIEVPSQFHAMQSAKRKTYCYRIYLSPRQLPLKDRYAVWEKGKVDLDAMKQACQLYVGEHDFKAYCASGSQVKTTVRTIYDCSICTREEENCTMLSLYVTGNGFLYNMVRTMAGTIIFCGLQRLTLEKVKASLELCDRSLVGKTMPAHGLTLQSVEYAGIDL